jgi:hypothetical protein
MSNKDHRELIRTIPKIKAKLCPLKVDDYFTITDFVYSQVKRQVIMTYTVKLPPVFKGDKKLFKIVCKTLRHNAIQLLNNGDPFKFKVFLNMGASVKTLIYLEGDKHLFHSYTIFPDDMER